MKLKMILTLMLITISALLFATDPWGEPEVLTGSMVVMTQVSINGSPASAGDVLAAFVTVDGIPQLRGKGPVLVLDGIPGCLLQIFTESNGESISFKVWDASVASGCNATQALVSEVNGTVGSYPDNMYQITAFTTTQITDPWDSPEILTGSMIVMAQVMINNAPASADDILAAFVTVGDTEQLRGKSQIQIINGVPGCLLQVFTEADGEVITFKIWDYSEQQIVTHNTTLPSVVDGSVGSYPNNMYIINAGGSTQQVENPVFSIPGGTYSSAQSVSISCATPGAQIRFTTNGTDPTEGSALYSVPINLSLNSHTIIKAKAFLSGWIPSNIVSADYIITGTVAIPSFNPPAGTYTGAQSVVIICSTGGAQIRYTTNGNEPTASSALYNSPIAIDVSTTLKAKAFLANWDPSQTATAIYTITGTVATPVFTPAAGEYEEPISVQITCSTPGAQIYYTLDGAEPTQSASMYSNPIPLEEDCTVKARAFLTDWLPSPIAEVFYDFPTSNPDAPSTPVIPGIQGAYPNPFRDKLSVTLGIKDGYQDYQFKIYNIRGECVHKATGIAKDTFLIDWDGRSPNGNKLPSGLYLLRFSSKEIQQTRRVIMY